MLKLTSQVSFGTSLAFAAEHPVSAKYQQIGRGKKIRIGVAGGGFGRDFHWHEHSLCRVTGGSPLSTLIWLWLWI
jgi:hypothetical protein